MEGELPGDPQAYEEHTRRHSHADPHQSALELSAEERTAVCEEAWRRGGIWFLGGTFSDVVENLESNTVVADFVRSKIDELIDDPETAEKLKPTTYPWGTKRVPIGSDYYETYNRPNVSLVDIRADPIEEITPAGIRTRSAITSSTRSSTRPASTL